jgi:signal transduction histidine kinase
MKVHALLEDILIWIKSQSDKFPIVPQEINFGNIFAELIENTKLSAANKNIAINYSAEDKTSIRADKNMIITISRNLVANAIKFTNAGGEIFLSAEMKFTEIIITVSDNGVGITPNRLIELFSITKITTTPGTNNEKGTGLGLLICKELVEKHGGKIWAESEIGKGTSFKFSIPISNNQE